MAASPSPAAVPAPWSNPAHVDPEEAFVASIASCHMLTFLWVASRQGFEVESYEDDAVGVMTNAVGVTVTTFAIAVEPQMLFTVMVTVYGPGARKVCVAIGPMPVPASPKFQV